MSARDPGHRLLERVPLVTNIAARATASLDGTWGFVLDPYESGVGDHLHSSTTGRSLAADDSQRWPPIQVPGDWNSQRPEYRYYEGAAWYRRAFRWRSTDDRRTVLHFAGSNQLTRVWCNGHGPAEHDGGFGPFCVEITGALSPGENTLDVMVDNTRRPNAVPGRDTEWWNYGGLHRSVTLLDLPSTFVRDAWVQLASDGSAIIGEIVLDGPEAAGRTVTVRIPELGVGSRLITDESGRAAVRILADPERWSPAHPRRYGVEWQLGAEVLTDEVGFRTVTTDGHLLVLNGEPVSLRGVTLHAEAPTEPRRAVGPTDASVLLGWAKELGADFVRLAHYQHDEAMVRECDRRGLFACCELPVHRNADFENDSTYDNAEEQLEELIVRDRNRASVVMWSVANETPPGPARDHFLAGLVDAARRLDPTRLVSASLLATPDCHRVLDDPLVERLDVVAVNVRLAPDGSDRAGIGDAHWENPFDKPVVMSDFGVGAVQGSHGAADEPWSEELQATVLAESLERADRLAWVVASTPAVLKDFRSPKRILPGVEDGFDRSGLTSDRGLRKAGFDVVRQHYRSGSS
jgi:beta-glucuronidase